MTDNMGINGEKNFAYIFNIKINITYELNVNKH